MSYELESWVRQANLVVRDDQLEPLFGDELTPRLRRLVTAKKEGRMEDITPNPERQGIETMPPGAPPEQRPADPGTPMPVRRDWVPALTGAAIVIVFGVVALLLFGGDRTTPLATDPDQEPMRQAIAAAEEFFDAHNAYDAERLGAVLADDVQINSMVLGWPGNPEPLERLMEYQSNAEFRYSPYRCDLRFRPDAARPDTLLWVICDYEIDSRYQEILQVGRLEGVMHIWVVGGLITRIDDTFPWEEWNRHIERPFIDWSGQHGYGFGSTYVVQHNYHESFDGLKNVLDEFEEYIDSR